MSKIKKKACLKRCDPDVIKNVGKRDHLKVNEAFIFFIRLLSNLISFVPAAFNYKSWIVR